MKKERIEHSTRKMIPKDSLQYKFGGRLKERMKEKEITQEKLAEMVGVSLDTVRSWCQHRAFPEYLHLGKLCEIFKPYRVDYFYGIVDAPNYDMQFISDQVGLTPEAVYALVSKANKWDKPVLSILLSHVEDDIDYRIKGSYPDVDTGVLLSYIDRYFTQLHKIDLIDNAINKNQSTMSDADLIAIRKARSQIKEDTNLLQFNITKEIISTLDTLQEEFSETYLSDRTYIERDEKNDKNGLVISEQGVKVIKG